MAYVEVPKAGTIWEHYGGDYYRVLLIATQESDQKQVVVYQASKDGVRWVRPLEEWVADVRPGVARYKYITG